MLGLVVVGRSRRSTVSVVRVDSSSGSCILHHGRSGLDNNDDKLKGRFWRLRRRQHTAMDANRDSIAAPEQQYHCLRSPSGCACAAAQAFIGTDTDASSKPMHQPWHSVDCRVLVRMPESLAT